MFRWWYIYIFSILSASDTDSETSDNSEPFVDPGDVTDEQEVASHASNVRNGSVHREEHHLNPFLTRKTVFEDKSLIFQVAKTRFIRQIKYSITDHLYELLCIPKGDGTHPTVRSLFPAIRAAIQHVLSELQKFYSADKLYQLYCTVCDSRITGGLNTGNYHLFTDAHIVASNVLSLLYNYLRSAQNMRIDRTFKINFKVLSVPHTIDKLRKKLRTRHGLWKARRFVKGGGRHSANDMIWAVPVGYPREPLKFESSCLVVTLFTGLCMLGKTSRFESKNLQCQNLWYELRPFPKGLLLPNKLGIRVRRGTEKLCRILDVKFEGGHNLHSVLERFSVIFGVKVVVVSQRNYKKVLFSTQKQIESEKDLLVLVQKFNLTDAQYSHIDLVYNMQAFENRFGKRCLKCLQIKGNFHACNGDNKCFACLRVVAVDNSTAKSSLRCNAQISQTLYSKYPSQFEKPICTTCICGLRCETRLCYSVHSKTCKSRGFLCMECKKFVLFRQYGGQLEALNLHELVCGSTFCRICFKIHEYLDDTHVCDIKIPHPPLSHPNYGVLFLFKIVDAPDASAGILIMEQETRNQFVQSLFLHVDIGDRDFEGPDHLLTAELYGTGNELNNYHPLGPFGRKISMPLAITNFLHYMSRSTRPTIAEKVLFHLMDGDRGLNFTLLSEGDDTLELIQSCLENHDIDYNLFAKNNSISKITIKYLNLNFIARGLHIEGELDVLGETFCSLNSSKFQTKENSLQAIKSDQRCDSPPPKKKDIPSFKSKLVVHTMHVGYVMLMSLVSYLQTCFDIQSIYLSNLTLQPTDRKLMFHPLSSLTRNGFFFDAMRYFCMKNVKVYTVPNENGKDIQGSRLELEIATIFGVVFPNCISAWSCSTGRKTFGAKVTIPDLYLPDHNLAIFVNECTSAHPHIGCPLKLGSKSFHGKSCDTLERSFKQKLKKLGEKHPSLNISVIRECEWRQLRYNLPVLNQFLSKFVLRPLQRLVPRDVVKGALTALVGDEYVRSKHQERWGELKFADINSAYSYAALNIEVPVGKCTVMVGAEIDMLAVNIANEQVFYKNRPIYGMVHCQIECPASEKHPYVSRQIRGTSMYINCRKCASQHSKKCKQHGITERSFETTIMIAELAYIVSHLGYKLYAIYEWHVYYETSNFLQNFVRTLISYRLKYSGFPEEITTEGDKSQYCELQNKKMGLTGDLALRKDNITFNPGKRFFSKSVQNAIYGKFLLSLDKPEMLLARTEEQLFKLWAKYEIQGLYACGNNVILQALTRKIKTSLNSNIVIGSTIVCFSKIWLHRNITKLEKEGKPVIFYDTDCIGYLSKDKDENDLPYGYAVGEFKNVFANCTVNKFMGLHGKAYSIEVRNNLTRELKQVTKMSGFQITCSNKKSFSISSLKKIRKGAKKVILQKRKKKNWQTCFTTKQQYQRRLSFGEKKMRIPVSVDGLNVSIPYGFCKINE